VADAEKTEIKRSPQAPDYLKQQTPVQRQRSVLVK
jgi:hypothetical protein